MDLGHAILSPSASGQAIHSRLYRAFGYARDYPCIQCGERALDWAYLYTAGDEEIRVDGQPPWSPHMEDYAPMCRRCHSRFDRENDPEMLQRIVNAAKAVPADVRRKAGEAFAERRRTDPAFRAQCEQQQHDAASLGGKALWQNPEHASRLRASLMKGALQRWACDECDYVSNAGTVQRHLNRTGHLGRREINV